MNRLDAHNLDLATIDLDGILFVPRLIRMFINFYSRLESFCIRLMVELFGTSIFCRVLDLFGLIERKKQAMD